AGEVYLGYPLLAGVEHIVKILVTPNESPVQPGHRGFPRRIDKNRQHLVDKVVPSTSGNRPRRQNFVARQYLLYQDVEWRCGMLLQSLAIGARVEEPVDVIDP